MKNNMPLAWDKNWVFQEPMKYLITKLLEGQGDFR